MLGQRVRAVVAQVTIEPLALLSCILFTLSTITTEELYLRHNNNHNHDPGHDCQRNHLLF